MLTGMDLLNRWIEVAAIPDEDWITRQLALGPVLKEYATEKQARDQREMQDRMNAAMLPNLYRNVGLQNSPQALAQAEAMQNAAAQQQALTGQQQAAQQAFAAQMAQLRNVQYGPNVTGWKRGL